MPTDTLQPASSGDTLDRELAGLDRLELGRRRRASFLRRMFTATWPKLVAAGIVIGIWQIAVWLEWKPEFLLPAPSSAFGELWTDLGTSEFWRAAATTMRRAIVGFTIALAIGGLIGIAVTRVRLLRNAIGSMITGLQTMPSVAWFPLAILLFGLNESAIMFVVVLGAAPSIANGIISGIDNVPPILRRAGTTMGARGVALYRDVVIPGAMPSVIAGLKQGWAFSWRSLMAGELLVIIPGTQSIGTRLDFARQFSNSESIIANMIVIFVIGILIDALVFGRVERAVLRRRGLTLEESSSPARVPNRRQLVQAATQR